MKIPLLKIKNDAVALFRERPNRFLGIVDIIEPTIERNVAVHIHDPGRLNDILLPGTLSLLRAAGNLDRKTQWDLIAGYCNEHWVLTHSGYHRAITANILQNLNISPFGELSEISAEVPYEQSRLDFVVKTANGSETWIEVKGCTLAADGVALFPDAPTVRGTKHLKTLMSLRKKGLNAAVFVLVFRMDATRFAPNEQIDPLFARTFYHAVGAGIQVYPLQFVFIDNTICYIGTLPVETRL